MDIAAVDIETSDPGLKTFGAGAIRGYGEILTVGVYCPSWGIDGWYTWEQFCEDEEVLALMADPDVIKVFHNGVYDMNWLQLWGEIEINNIDDTMTRETLLDAYAMSYSLDSCCQRRGVTGKNKGDTIDAWWVAHGGKGKAIEHLKDIPVEIVGKYNIQDCHATYDLFFAQQPLLEQQDLIRCNDIERKLYPWLMMTKQNGMRMDIKKRQELSRTLEKELDELETQFKEEYGNVNVGSYIEMEKLWKRLGIPVVYSDTGRPSFSHDVLADTEHPVAALILHIRGLDKLLNTFVDGQFVDLAYRGRLHPDLYPALRDEGGTVTGRFSCLAIGTNVFTVERGYVPIETLRVGEHVITHTGTIRPIKDIMFTGIREVGRYNNLLCTASHLLFDGEQWVSAELNPAVMEVDENELIRRQRLSQESSGFVPVSGQADKSGSLQTSWCMFSVCSSDTERGHPVRCLGSGEGSQILPLQAWREEPDERQETSELCWGSGRWSRAPTEESEREVLLYTSDSNGRGTWHRCIGTARLGGHTPHRWKSEEQRVGESLFGDSSWTQTLTRRVSVDRGWEPMGIIPTFDIEVDGPEHSFVAEGIIVHNSRNPNGQNIPARGDKHGEEIRSLFIPEDGCLLGAFDYKQIEYRVFTHFAYGPGAEEAQAAYWDHPVDYHQMVQEMMGWVTGDKKKDKEFRHVTKNLNFTCRSTDSYFATRRGYIKAIDLLDEDRLTMDSGEWRAFIGRKQQYRILLSNGQEHKVTHDHPFKFFGKKVGASELRVGDVWDVVPCTCFGDYQTETITVPYHRIPRTQEFKIDENAAYIIGLWLGDGSLHIQYKTGLPQALSFCTDPEHTNYVIDLIGLKPIFAQRTDTFDIWYVSNKFLATWFNDNCGRTKDKHIPDVIYRSPRSVIIALLKGFLDSDGTVHNKRPQLVNTSESLMRQLARCMAMIGWEARMSSEAYHTVTPQGKEYHGTLYRLVPHRTPQLHKEFQGVLRKWDEPQEYHSAKSPVTIVSIEDIGEQDTMCISLPDPHWYEAECCINHNSIYGLGWRSFAERFKEPLLNAHPGWPKEDVGKLAKMLLEQYFDKIPFVRPTCQLIQQTAQRRGYVKTVSGRRQRFPPDNKAYKMVNYLIQGSAGDIMKKAIVDAWNQGVWNVLKPHMMVHDELVFSIPKTREGYEACVKLKECMEHSYKLKIPLGVDTEIGPDWGHCNEENWLEFEKQFKEVTDE